MDIFSRRYQSPLIQQAFQRPFSKVAQCSFVIALMLLLAACGPADESPDQTTLTLATQQIAQDYANTGDLAKAQSSLAALEVANPNQWLLFVAESTANDAAAQPELTAALIKFADASGLRSPILTQYATTHGLLNAPTPAVQQVAAAALVDAQQSAPPAAAAPAPAPAEATATTASEPVALEATATSAPEPTATAAQQAQVVATALVNLRSGPGTVYDLAGGLQAGESATILAKNQDASWWQIQLASGTQGWVFGELVQTSGALDPIAVAANIPPPPTAAPVVVAQATQPAAQPTAAAAVEATAAPTAVPQQNGGAPYFSVVQRRMWSKAENGDCRGQHLLRIHVTDANGTPLNGITLKGIYTGEIRHTGEQGKGDGIIEYDLYGSGEGFIVTNDSNGAEAGSDRAEGFTTNSRDIDKPTLIGGGYCSDDATCQTFYDQWGCKGHHSWEATFKRNY